jgi:mRNA interferase MazF
VKIKRWGVYLVDLRPRVGTKPGKLRPCVVIQDDVLNDIGHPSTVILPISSQLPAADAYPLRVRLVAGEAGLVKASVVLVDQFLAWDNARFMQQLGSLSLPKATELEAACRAFFGWL